MTVRPEIQAAFDAATKKYATGQQMAGGFFPATYQPEPVAPLGGETLVGRIFDILARGEYASANLSRDYILGREFDLDSAIKGLKAEEGYKTTYDELAPIVFPDWSPWKQKTMGFLMAIFADPTTYIPTKTITEATKVGLKAVGETKTIKPLVTALGKSKIAKAFVPSAGVPKPYYETKYYAQKALQAENEAIIKDIENLRSGLSKSDMDGLSYFREHPLEIDSLTPKLRQKLDDIGQRFDDLIDDAYRNGIIDDDQMAKWMGRQETYLYHHYPARGLRLARGEIPPTLFEKVKKPSFLKKRTFETIEDAKALSNDFASIADSKTIEEATEKITQLGLDDAFGRKQWSTFDELKSAAQAMSDLYKPEENILKLLAYRRLEQAGYKARKNFVNNVLDQFGKRVRYDTVAVPEGYGLYFPKGNIRFYLQHAAPENKLYKLIDEYGEMIPADEIMDAIKGVPGITKRVPLYMLDKDIAQDMNRMNKFFANDPSSRWISGLFDKGQNAWKLMATTVRLPFHLRNMYSNWWQAYLSGLNNPKRFLDAAAFQSGKLKSIKLGDKVFGYDELKTLTDNLGVHGKGWIGSDVQQSMLGELESIIKYGKFRKLNPFNAGRVLGTTIEDNSRIAVFLDQLAKGATPKDASRVVRKYLFDYTELTDFEKTRMRRIFPFYTWTRKNIVLQTENLLRQPRKYQQWQKGLRAFAEPETSDEAEFKPKYFNELLYVKSPRKTEQGKPVYYSIDLPPLEFNRISSLRHHLSSLSPYKIFVELAMNVKTFPKIGKLKSYPLDKTFAPFWIAYLPKKLQKTLFDRNILGEVLNKETGNMELAIDRRYLHALHGLFPFTTELDRMYAQPISLDDENPKMKWKSYRSGIGHAALDVSLQREREVWRLGKFENNLRKFIIQHGREPNEAEMSALMPEDY